MKTYKVFLTQGGNDKRPLGNLTEYGTCIEVLITSPYMGVYNNLFFRASNLCQTDKLIQLIINGSPSQGRKEESISIKQSIVNQLCYSTPLMASPRMKPDHLEEWIQVHRYLIEQGFSVTKDELLWERQNSHIVGKEVFTILKFIDTRPARAFIQW